MIIKTLLALPSFGRWDANTGPLRDYSPMLAPQSLALGKDKHWSNYSDSYKYSGRIISENNIGI